MKPVTIASLGKKKAEKKKITVLTAHDYPFARLIDEAGVDCILVSDVLGQVGLGYDSTVPVSLEEMAVHTRAVCRGVSRALVIAKMPFLSAAGPWSDTLAAARTLVKDAGAKAVEVEGGREIIPVVRRLVAAGIPVMPHIGATAQDFMRSGVFRVQGKTAAAAQDLLALALDLQAAGAFAIMLECVPSETAALITDSLEIPVLGIGAGAQCDGQILVTHDILGLFDKFVPKFVQVYRNMGQEITAALTEFVSDVDSQAFPAEEHSYFLKPEELEKLR